MKTLVLAGNPNVGKSIFFQNLTGIYVEVSNFPGTTVEVSRGKYKDYAVCDTPGVYGVSSFNEEEKAARDVILQSDIIVNVIDGTHLSRDMFLTQQLIDMGKRVIVCLNMMDEAEKKGLEIDVDKLSALLGVPVIPTAAAAGKNMQAVRKRLEEARTGHKTPEIVRLAEEYLPVCGNFAEAVLLLEDDDFVRLKYQQKPCGMRDTSYRLRRERVETILHIVLRKSEAVTGKKARMGQILTRPLTGIPILLATLAVMFVFLGVVVAQWLVGITEGVFMKGMYEPFIFSLVGRFCDPASVLGQLLIGDFGLLTMTPTYIIGLLLPLVAGFYLVLSLLEDSGYLPRIAVLLDKLLSKIGLNGRAVIPLMLGFGCVTAATVSTRLLGTRRERVIATALLGLTIPCSAQFGIILGNVSQLGAGYMLLYATIIAGVFCAAGKGMDHSMKGNSSDLLIDLPQMRIPQGTNVLRKVVLKTKQFLKEALPVFALGGALITILDVSGLLNWLVRLFSPLVTVGLKLPEEAAVSFIMGIIRRDFGAAGLHALALDQNQTLVAMVTLTLFVPCAASVMMIFKERTKGEAAAIWIGSFALAFGIGSALAHILNWF